MNPEEKNRRIEFSKQFIKECKFNAILYCNKWNGTNGRTFREKQPEDFIFIILEKIIEGKSCNLDSFVCFRNSVYYHLENAMLNYFYPKNEKEFVDLDLPEDSSETNLNSLQIGEELSYCSESFLDDFESDDLVEKVHSLFDPDTEVEEIMYLEEFLKGGKRECIAQSLGITQDECTVIKKRTDRKMVERWVKKYRMEIINE
ncbi:MAG: hypothetical protein Q8L04_14350 [Ignavibacteria bacterium]|nr:hypothetical protein [Ignavibacteria bacterium]